MITSLWMVVLELESYWKVKQGRMTKRVESKTYTCILDLDAMAGSIAYQHIDNGDPQARPVTIVTACVDRFDLFLPKAVEDYKLTGQVTYVGRSSMESKLNAITITDIHLTHII